MPKLDESIKANLFDGNNQSIDKNKFKPVYECGYCLVFGLAFNICLIMYSQILIIHYSS